VSRLMVMAPQFQANDGHAGTDVESSSSKSQA
jgi:hypothetical protein